MMYLFGLCIGLDSGPHPHPPAAAAGFMVTQNFN